MFYQLLVWITSIVISDLEKKVYFFCLFALYCLAELVHSVSLTVYIGPSHSAGKKSVYFSTQCVQNSRY